MVTEAEEQEKMLTARDIARMWGVGLPRAYQMLASGELPAVRVGRAIRVPESKLRQWIDKQTEGAANRD